MGNFRTPLIASQREDGSTFYTFSSAMEDIGLNINERNNKVRLSNYVLLDIPEICFQDNAYYDSGYFNLSKFFLNKYSGGKDDDYTAFKADLKNGSAREWFKIGLQNYMMNMETTLRNQGTYDHSNSASVTERCFWKFLRHSGAFNPDIIVDGKYFHEDWGADASISPDNTVIKGFGTIETSSQSSNVYTINNETYVLVPSSYGQMKYLLEPVEDNNYIINAEYEITSKDILLEGHTPDSSIDASINNEYLLPFTDSATNAYSYFIGDSGSSITQSKEQMLQMVFDKTVLKETFAPDLDSPSISYDELASNTEYILSSKYKFNAILIYYTIYDSVGNSIATNLFGILILNDIVKTTDNPGKDYNNLFKFDEIVKYKSNNGKVGSSYFFRLNLQTASIYDNTNTQIIDFSSGEAGVIQDFSDVVANLKTTVDILKGNAVVFNNLHNDITQVKHESEEAILKIDDMQRTIDDMASGNVRTISADEVDSNTLKTDSIEAKDASQKSSKKFFATDGTIQEVNSGIDIEDIATQLIDDGSTANNRAWSADKINTELSTKQSITHVPDKIASGTASVGCSASNIAMNGSGVVGTAVSSIATASASSKVATIGAVLGAVSSCVTPDQLSPTVLFIDDPSTPLYPADYQKYDPMTNEEFDLLVVNRTGGSIDLDYTAIFDKNVFEDDIVFEYWGLNMFDPDDILICKVKKVHKDMFERGLLPGNVWFITLELKTDYLASAV